MKKTFLAAAVLSCAVGTFAYDEYGTVKAKSLEADVMYTHTFGMGVYNSDGDKKDYKDWNGEDISPAYMAPSLQLKYGIIDGLDVEAVVPFLMTNKDAGDKSGLNKPQIDVKYLNPIGVGVLVGVDLPLGGEDIVGTDPALALRGGLILSKNIDKLALNGWALYTHNFEDGSEAKYKAGDVLDFYVKPQYNVTDKIGPYLGIDFIKTFDSESDGNSNGDAGYLLTLKPGLNYVINDKFGAELNVPVTILGKNQTPSATGPGASVSIYAGFYSTFAL
jgi:hypothetical protein